MKKVLLWICILGTLSAQAEIPCMDGTIIVANNGTHFCMSNITMNWWSAEAWCNFQGENIHLAKFEDMCPGTAKKFDVTCSNLAGAKDLEGNSMSSYVWSDFAIGSDYFLNVRLSGGLINHSYYSTYKSYYNAFCEEVTDSSG